MVGLALILLYVGRFLLGAAFVVFGIRNLANIPRLTDAMEKKCLLPVPGIWMTAGVGIQIVGGALVIAAVVWVNLPIRRRPAAT